MRKFFWWTAVLSSMTALESIGWKVKGAEASVFGFTLFFALVLGFLLGYRVADKG
jgi:hypothetical protein